MKLAIRILRRTAAIFNGLCVLALLLVLLPAVGLRAAAEWQNTDTPALLGRTVVLIEEEVQASGLQTGALVLLKAPESYAIGDLVGCRDGGEAVFGAVLGQQEGRFLLYDTAAGQARSGSIPAEQMLGVVHTVLPQVGAWLAAAQTDRGLLTLVIVGVVLADLPGFLRPRREKVPDAENPDGNVTDKNAGAKPNPDNA